MVEVTLQKASESREAWPSQGIPHLATSLTSLAFINPPSPLFMQTQVAAAFDHAHRASLCPWAIASLSSSGASRHMSHLPALGAGWSVPPPPDLFFESRCPENEFAQPSRIWLVFERPELAEQ